MPSSALAIAMQRAMSGTLAMEDVARIVVTSAVDETIRAISLEYGLNPNEVRKKHFQRIVDTHSTFDERGCAQKTTRGEVCARPAVYGSKCPIHHTASTSPPKARPTNKTSENAAWVQRVVASISTVSTVSTEGQGHGEEGH